MRIRTELARPLGVLTFLLATGSGFVAAQQPAAPAGPPPMPLVLTSTGFKEGEKIPLKFTCTAAPNVVSPALQWTNVPANTQSFALIFHDLEPRPQRGFADNLHWMMWNIPATTTSLPEGVPATAEFPDGTRQFLRQQQNNTVGYGGPCPPMNIPVPHHYVFDLFALDTKLTLPATATRAEVEAAINGHIIGHAVLVGLFNR